MFYRKLHFLGSGSFYQDTFPPKHIWDESLLMIMNCRSASRSSWTRIWRFGVEWLLCWSVSACSNKAGVRPRCQTSPQFHIKWPESKQIENHVISRKLMFSRRRRTFVQWSHSHSRFLFCPDPMTLPSTFAHTVKKNPPSGNLSFKIHNISLLKKNLLSGFCSTRQKSGYQRPWNVLQRTILRFWSSAQPRSHRYRTSHWIALDALNTHNEAWGAPCRARQDLVSRQRLISIRGLQSIN